MNSAKDMYGNFITAGDFINYPGRNGSHLYMRTAKVLEVTTRKNLAGNDDYSLKVATAIPIWGQNITTSRIRRTNIARPERTTIIPKAYVQHTTHFSKLMDF